MIDNLNLTFLAGGFFRCDPGWNKAASSIDACYKFYFPVKGRAFIEFEDATHTLECDHIYFFSGYSLKRQYCDNFMDVYWIHVQPESPLLNFYLSKCPRFYEWKPDVLTINASEFIKLIQLFEDPFGGFPEKIAATYPISAYCKIEALLLYCIGDLIETQRIEKEFALDRDFLRINGALDYINDNFKKNLRLTDIAQSVNLAPNYFHHLFTKTFGFTPLEYLTKKKLYAARNLLASTTRSIQEIAEEIGYTDQFYFSRAFKRLFECKPSDVRRKKTG